ncbi:MAG: hypothetical protein ACRC1T_05110 [Clostridium chrysemydis]|uniref:hypothetical protein n=1 Tax=Clostridium chrysemydis TaxID=2665504 RepID=UPI003F327F70
MRLVKCPKCGTKNEKENTVKHGRGYYCQECFEDVGEYKELISTICEIYNIEAPTIQMVSQVKDYKDKYNFTNSGMKYTLKYYYEILENKVKDNVGLGIVPYFYDRAKQYYKNRFILEEKADEFINEERLKKFKVVRSNKKDFERKELNIAIDWSEVNEE